MRTIIGPPGTGKTTRISQLVAEAAQKYGAEKVAVCSLTRTSARKAASMVDMPDSQVGTLHSFAFHALGQPDIADLHVKEWNENYGAEYGFGHSSHLDAPYDVYVESEAPSALQKKSGDTLRQEYYQLRMQQVPSVAWPADVCKFHEAWSYYKSQCDYLDFTDLIETALTDCATLPRSPQFFALDEAQDFGELEMALVGKWAARTEECVQVGDYHQSLFVFRGGGNKSLETPHRDVLDQSFRIPRAVHRQALRWMKRTGLPPVEYKPRDFDGIVHQGTIPYKQVNLYGGRLMSILDPAIRKGKTVTLLTTCGYMLDGILRFLVMEGIPFANPLREQNGRWNPLARQYGKWSYADRVLAFMRPSPDVWGEEARFWTTGELKAWAKPLPTSMFQRGQKRAIEKLPANTPDTGIAMKMREWFTPDALTPILQQDVDWYLQHAEGGQYNRTLVTGAVRRYGCPILKEEKPLVNVGTVHSLKGSESSIVCLWPDLSPQAAGMSLSFGAQTSLAQRKAEAARVFYVGVTRAKEELYLMPPSSTAAVAW